MAGNVRRRRGYEAERAICRYLGAERIAGSGRRDGDGGWYALEAKSREKLPAWLTAAMAQAERLSRPEQLAVLVLHQLGDRHDDDLVVVRLRDFRDRWVGEEEEGPCS